MLTAVEKLIFAIAVLVSLYFAYITFRRMVKIILRGQGRIHVDHFPRRLLTGLVALVSQGRMIRQRPVTFLFHAFIAWGFIFYLLVNMMDVLDGYIPGFRFLSQSTLGGIYRLLADVLSIAVLGGMAFFLIRRFAAKTPVLAYHNNVKLHPKALSGISRDSLMVGVFILAHVGFRFLGASFLVAMEGGDAWQPFANGVAKLWSGLPEPTLTLGWRMSWWVALGLILVFVPYFPYTKHAHLFMGPFNWMTRPQRKSLGALDAIDFNDESIEQFGAARLTELSRTHIVDAFACIMCNRCQDVCPAYVTGKALSPAALEVNKRYYIRENMKSLAAGKEDPLTLLEYAISESAVWACTSCGACVTVCPVGNEPMFDILDIRRDLVLMKGDFPNQLKGAFTGIERVANPWQMTDDRLAWAKSLDFPVPTVEENPDFDALYWVGCAGAFDPNAQKTARAIVTILHAAGVNFAVLGKDETCTADLARRAGNEYLFFEMAQMNIETLNAAGADKKKIVTGCPHCLHTLRNEYPAFGGNYTVLHHTQLISELIGEGRLKLSEAGLNTSSPPPNPSTFCCGAGGAQVWKEEEKGAQTVNANRYAEAQSTGAEILAVGCPFCTRMLSDANTQSGEAMVVKDIAEIVAEAIVPSDESDLLRT